MKKKIIASFLIFFLFIFESLAKDTFVSLKKKLLMLDMDQLSTLQLNISTKK